MKKLIPCPNCTYHPAPFGRIPCDRCFNIEINNMGEKITFNEKTGMYEKVPKQIPGYEE